MGIADCHFKETGMAEKTTQQASLRKIISTWIIQSCRMHSRLYSTPGAHSSSQERQAPASPLSTLHCCPHQKKHIILAPTGIAAINAGGSTLHSFFKIPFHPLLPNDSMFSVRNIRNTLKYNSEKIKIIREVELIIIDEISMVRADIIDFIDKVLRIYSRNMREPFGGKQLLLVGISISWNLS